MGALEPWHLVVILGIALIVFGPGRISEIGGTLGKAVRDFREVTEGKTHSTSEPPAAIPPSASTQAQCPRCGADVEAVARFCPRCGAPLAASAEPRPN